MKTIILSLVLICNAALAETGLKTIDDATLNAVEYVESTHNPKKTGLAGERGLFQIMPGTWSQMTKEPWSRAYDPALNRKIAIAYYAWIEKTLTRRLGHAPSQDQVLAAYNCGVGRLARGKFDVEKVPASTREYLKKIKREKAHPHANSRNR